MVGRRQFGAIKKLRSGRYQTSYVGPDEARHLGPITFERKQDAIEYLATVQTDIARGIWEAPEVKRDRERAERLKVELGSITFNEWADRWLESLPGKKRSPKTIQTHRYRLNVLREEFGDMEIAIITKGDVVSWYERKLADRGHGVVRPQYMTLSTCMNAAVKDGRIEKNPCQIENATKHTPVKDPNRRQVATPEEVKNLAAAMPDEWAIAVWLAAWCQVREGEMIGLRRSDIDLKREMLKVQRQTQFLTGEGGEDIGTKSESADREISIPTKIIPIIKKHLKTFVGKTPEARLIHKPGFPSEPLHPNTLRGAWNRARAKVGMEWFVFHDLRHTGLTIYAQNGATLAELLNRGGHSDIEVALSYQHATIERDQALTKKMDEDIEI